MESKWIKPYGDHLDDGIVQLSFTLPVENDSKAVKAAEMYVAGMKLEDISVVHAQKISDGFTYFVVFAKAIHTIDFNTVRPDEVKGVGLSFEEVNRIIKEHLKRPLCVVGASVGNDAHTVGIDSIMNMKGYHQDYGLERYEEIDAHNLGAQVSCEYLLQKALEFEADAILVSQTVTQQESHVRNFTEFVELLEAERKRECFVVIAGGSRISNNFAVELGYDAGFGSGTVPSQVASFLASKIERIKHAHGKGK